MFAELFSNEAYLIIALGFMFGMVERVFDLLETIWWWLIPFQVVDQYEMGVILRWGLYVRTVGPGLRWMWPCGIEKLLSDTVVRTTSWLDVQSLTTKDGQSINSSLVLVWKIGNIKRWLLEVDDAEDALHDISYGFNDELTTRTDLVDMPKEDFVDELYGLIADAALAWGGRVMEVKFADRARSKSLRLWTGSADE